MGKTYGGWYVLYVKSRHEKRVHQRLKDLKLNSFLPLVQTVRQWSDRKKKIKKPLFPNYVFVEIATSKDLYTSCSVPGTFQFIKCGGNFSRLTLNELNYIKTLIGLKDIINLELTSSIPQKGETRKINFGPLKGLEGEILEASNCNKILIRIEALNQSVIATVPLTCLSEK